MLKQLNEIVTNVLFARVSVSMACVTAIDPLKNGVHKRIYCKYVLDMSHVILFLYVKDGL